MSRATVAIDPDLMPILQSMTVIGFMAFLPPGQLDRKVYERVDKVLRALGGKWNRSKSGHEFSEDPRPLLGQSLDKGTITDRKKLLNQFFTPAHIARQVAGHANIPRRMSRWFTILEPSAGHGGLLAAALEHAMEATAVAVEIDEKLLPSLRRLFMSPGSPLIYASTLRYSIHLGDFLGMTKSGLCPGGFDRIVMNPPFENGVDIKHIEHAYSMLKPGGRLVSICAAGPRQERRFLDDCVNWDMLPEGAFTKAGTNVSTAIVVLDKPEK